MTTKELRESIPRSVRNQLLEDRTCRYCEAPWASVIDHVIPVVQGGRSVIDNLAPACWRCNSQKSGRTPAQWKAWRVERGMAWPPPNCAVVLPAFLTLFLDDADKDLFLAAARAKYPPLWEAIDAYHDSIYLGEDGDLPDDAARLMSLAQQWRDEVDV